MSVKLNDKQKLLIFINLMITGIATSMLATAMTMALPPIVEYFGISTITGQWMTSGYSLAMGIVMPLTAFLVKKISTKKLYISGIICFIIGELACIFVPGFSIMMAVGNGILTSMGQVIILSIYPANKKGDHDGPVWTCGHSSTDYCTNYSWNSGRYRWLEIYIYLYNDHYAHFSRYVSYSF